MPELLLGQPSHEEHPGADMRQVGVELLRSMIIGLHLYECRVEGRNAPIRPMLVFEYDTFVAPPSL